MLAIFDFTFCAFLAIFVFTATVAYIYGIFLRRMK